MLKTKKIYQTPNLKTKVGELYHVGEIYKKRLKKLGIHSVRDLLLHFPSRYEDLSTVKPIIEAKINESATFRGRVLSINSRRTRNSRITITEVIIADDSSTIKAIFFNQPFLMRILKPQDQIIVAGKVDFRPYFGRYLANPIYQKTMQMDSPHLGRIIPIYPETKGINSKWLRSIIKPLLKISDQLDDYLPTEIKENMDLIDLNEAIRQIHFPDFIDSLKAAIHRLAFDELFIIALRSALIKNKFKNQKATKITFDSDKTAKFVRKLPFKLTNAQRIAAWEIIKDMERTKPMNRLLNGDVGSGKTAVAAVAALGACSNGKQVAIMAPTEVLAYQHYQNFQKYFKKFNVEICLKTRSYNYPSKKSKTKPKSKKLTADIVIGTHALIQKSIKFNDLGLVIVDEQHRFGVQQRAQIKKNNLAKTTPHFLSLTATPIPRTLALALYGELDISTLDEYPKGRQKIKTYLIPLSKRKWAYEFIRSEVKKDHQVFVICPLIEKKSPNQTSQFFDFDNRKAVMEEYNKLSQEIFPELKIDFLHGKMKAQDKEKIMNRFRKRITNILISTSIIEVGVDIPNATVMMIDGAERFGLSQLHQFRGRVGRGKHQSYCFLFTNIWSEKIKIRLSAMVSTDDGFKIAEADLKLRGPGEIYGTRQHGLVELKFASLSDIKLIKSAKKEVGKLMIKDPTLKNWPKLLKYLRQFEKMMHLE